MKNGFENQEIDYGKRRQKRLKHSENCACYKVSVDCIEKRKIAEAGLRDYTS